MEKVNGFVWGVPALLGILGIGIYLLQVNYIVMFIVFLILLKAGGKQ